MKQTQKVLLLTEEKSEIHPSLRCHSQQTKNLKVMGESTWVDSLRNKLDVSCERRKQCGENKCSHSSLPPLMVKAGSHHWEGSERHSEARGKATHSNATLHLLGCGTRCGWRWLWGATPSGMVWKSKPVTDRLSRTYIVSPHPTSPLG